jgi:hypothetical protein
LHCETPSRGTLLFIFIRVDAHDYEGFVACRRGLHHVRAQAWRRAGKSLVDSHAGFQHRNILRCKHTELICMIKLDLTVSTVDGKISVEGCKRSRPTLTRKHNGIFCSVPS